MFASQKALAATLAAASVVVPSSVLAEFAPIKTRVEFVETVSDKNLTKLGIQLTVKPDGRIVGRAMGWDVSGEWQWSPDGFFCRQLDWGGDDIGYNCQAVSVDGNRVKFQSDRGQGQHAVLTMR